MWLCNTLICIGLVSWTVCSAEKRLLFNIDHGHTIGEVHNKDLSDASGLCASRRYPGLLYTHNDRGGQNRLFVLNATTAQVEAVLVIDGAQNVDWEDLACGPCYDHLDDWCVYIGDIGGSKDHRSATTIYRIVEPELLLPTTHVPLDSKLTFSWHEIDSDTLMVAPDAEVYVISRVDHGTGLIAHIPSEGWGSGHTVPANGTQRLQLHTSHSDPLSADISPNGMEVLVKLREDMLHFSMFGQTSYQVGLSHVRPHEIPFDTKDHQGEAVAFSVDGNSYYTIGEGHNPTLKRYDVVQA